jgi:hypothetical protein
VPDRAASRNEARIAAFGNRGLRALATMAPNDMPGSIHDCAAFSRQPAARLAASAGLLAVNRRAAREAAQAKLDLAYDKLEQHAPDRLARAIRWLRNPRGRAVRLPLGIVLVVAGLLGPVLPFLGVELIPIGLLLIAQDVPPLREPVAQMTLWLEGQWVRLRLWLQRRRRAGR